MPKRKDDIEVPVPVRPNCFFRLTPCPPEIIVDLYYGDEGIVEQWIDHLGDIDYREGEELESLNARCMALFEAWQQSSKRRGKRK